MNRVVIVRLFFNNGNDIRIDAGEGFVNQEGEDKWQFDASHPLIIS